MRYLFYSPIHNSCLENLPYIISTWSTLYYLLIGLIICEYDLNPWQASCLALFPSHHWQVYLFYHNQFDQSIRNDRQAIRFWSSSQGLQPSTGLQLVNLKPILATWCGPQLLDRHKNKKNLLAMFFWSCFNRILLLKYPNQCSIKRPVLWIINFSATIKILRINYLNNMV